MTVPEPHRALRLLLMFVSIVEASASARRQLSWPLVLPQNGVLPGRLLSSWILATVSLTGFGRTTSS
jgi:hypothetical protein